MNMSAGSNTTLAQGRLAQRAAWLRRARQFFDERGILEVDTPALSHYAPIDRHIDVMCVSVGEGEVGYLHTSPEYAMKRLLAEGSGDIYYLGHVYRQGEYGPQHNPEFTMAEWYRCGFSFAEMIEETLAFCRLFLGDLPASHLSYAEALYRSTGLSLDAASPEDLLAYLAAQDHSLSPSLRAADRDTLLQLIVPLFVEPHLGQGELTVLYGFPASQAALAEVGPGPGGEPMALRFELYAQGIELANGYQELRNPVEQRTRLLAAAHERSLAGKEPLPLDELFVQALERGLPACCGVAVGFDRLVQLHVGAPRLADILSFAWDRI